MPMNPRLLRPLAAGGFDPKKLSGLLLWLDASDASTVTIDTGVSEWRDKSGLGQKMQQGSGGNQPAYLTDGIGGKPALGFTGSSSHFMRSSFSHSFTGATAIVVARMAGATGVSGRIFSLGVTGQTNGFSGTGAFEPSMRFLFGNSVGCYYAEGTRAEQAVTLDTPFIQCASISGAVLSNRVNNNAAVTHTAGSSWSASIANMMLSTFSASGAASGFLTGRIAEVIVYSREVSDDERSKLHQYLGKKYGITVS